MTRIPALGICGGGTGGHIFPALAVVQELQHTTPEIPIYYFGRQDGMEYELMLREPVTFCGIKAGGFTRSFSWKNAASLWQAGASLLSVRRVIREKNIRAMLGTGGYVCGPVIMAAASLGIPTVIHESNFIPGLTNRWLSGWATVVGVSFAPTGKYFPNRRVTVTGFPLREGLNDVSHEAGCRFFGLDPNRRVLFVFPGSQAARKINQTLIAALPGLAARLGDVQLLWMAGEAEARAVKQACEERQIPAVVLPFVHEVPEAYAAADLVLARAGAGTVAELSATGTPALLIPYPFAAANHQVHNAAVLQKYGSAEVLEEKDLDPEVLLTRLHKVFLRLDYMRSCAAVLRADYPKQAARKLARILREMIKK